MIKRVFITILFGTFLCLRPGLGAEETPRPTGWVNDYAGVISGEYRDKLTPLIEELRDKTSSEIFVVTVQSIAPYDEKGYARLLFDSWKPGKKGKDNGVLVLLAIKERRWRIETGYGVEGILPDGVCGEIGRNYMVPSFKEGNYGKGLYLGVLEIAKIIAKNENTAISIPAGSEPGPESSSDATSGILFYILFGIIFLVIVILSNLSRGYSDGGYSGTSWGGGGFGGGGFGGGGFGGGGGGGGGGGF